LFVFLIIENLNFIIDFIDFEQNFYDFFMIFLIITEYLKIFQKSDIF